MIPAIVKLVFTVVLILLVGGAAADERLARQEGALVRSGTPRPIVDRVNAEINCVVRDPQIAKDAGIKPE